MYGRFACMYVCTLVPLELELQMVISHYVGAGNQMHIF